MQADSVYWAVKNRVRLIGGTVFTLEGYEHIADVMRDEARQRAIMKGAQGGGTTLLMVDAIHGLVYGKYPQGVIYYFPTESSVEAFSKTRFTPMIDDNPVIKKYLKNTNSVSIKKVGNTFLSLLGAKSTHILQGEKRDSTSVRSTPADYILRDERDLFEDDMAEQTKQRILNSKIKKEVDLGTPTIPDFGISKCFNESDQKHWLVKCDSCNTFTDLGEDFPNCVKFKDKNAYFACKKCGAVISPRNGQWVAKYPDIEVSGYWIPHLLNANIDLNGVMKRYSQNLTEGKIGEFYNSILGLPYIAAEDRLTQNDVFACCDGEVMATDCPVGTAMGVDIGKTFHVVIAKRLDNGSARIIYMARIGFDDGWTALHDLANKFNVKSAVIDLRPYEDSFRVFQKGESYKVFGCEYRDKMRHFEKVDDKEGVYVVSRTEIFDKTHIWTKSRKLLIPRRCSEVEEFARQMCNTAKVLEENERGDRLYRYRKLGDEHYRNAVNYLWLAVQNLYESDIYLQPHFIQKEPEYNPLTYGL